MRLILRDVNGNTLLDRQNLLTDHDGWPTADVFDASARVTDDGDVIVTVVTIPKGAPNA